MRRFSQYLALALLAAMLVFSRDVFWRVRLAEPIEAEDIYYSYVEGGRILNGTNPYERILSGDMRENEKYATYFPLFYELSALSQRMGLDEFGPWLSFWRRAFLLFNWGVACLLYYALARKHSQRAGLFAAAFWLFNRWNLAVISIAHLDYLPIFFLCLSLILFPRHKLSSHLSLGISLGLKQVAIFIVPLYLVWAALSAGKSWLKETLKAGAWIAAIPFAASLPFLIWNAEGFIKSILFSVTRWGVSHFVSALSLDDWMEWQGIPARLPMFLLFFLVYLLAYLKPGGRYAAAFLVMAIFIGFNSVLFIQYLLWIMPLAPLVLLDSVERSPDEPSRA